MTRVRAAWRAAGRAAGGPAGRPWPAFAPAPNNPDFAVAKNGQKVINEIYVSPCAVSTCGVDLLGVNTLAPGARLNLLLPAGQCMNDARVVFNDGQATERRQVNTRKLTRFAFP